MQLHLKLWQEWWHWWWHHFFPYNVKRERLSLKSNTSLLGYYKRLNCSWKIFRTSYCNFSFWFWSFFLFSLFHGCTSMTASVWPIIKIIKVSTKFLMCVGRKHKIVVVTISDYVPKNCNFILSLVRESSNHWKVKEIILVDSMMSCVKKCFIFDRLGDK